MNKKTQVERDKKRAAKNEYLERKKKLVELEEKNYDKIILLEGTDGYWVFGGHSAVILAYKVAEKSKMRVGIKRDTDFDYKFEEGVISVQNVGFYVEEIKKSPLVKNCRKTAHAYTFTLKNKISETEYKLLAKSPELKKQKLENMIIKSHPMPQVNMRVEEVMKNAARLYRKYNDPVGRELMTRRFFEQTRVAHKIVLLIARGEMDKKAGLKKIEEILSAGMADVMQISVLEFWSVGDCTAMSATIIAAINAIEIEKRDFT